MLSSLNVVVNTSQRYVCVTRPRRFGKTTAADMLCAYYGRETDGRSLFEKCRISQVPESSGTHAWDEYLGKFDVIKLVMTVFFKTGISVDESLAKLQKMIVRDLAKAYPEVDFLTKRI